MISTSFENVKPGQKFRTIGDPYAMVRIFENGSAVDLDVLSVDTITLTDHGDADGALVSVDREYDVIKGTLHLDAWAQVELIAPQTNLTYVSSGHEVHSHRAVDGYTVCDDTATYWA